MNPHIFAHSTWNSTEQSPGLQARADRLISRVPAKKSPTHLIPWNRPCRQGCWCTPTYSHWSASEYQPETRLGIAIYGGARRRHRKRPVYGPYPPSSIAFTVMVYGGRLRENRARFTGGNTREPDPAFCRTIPIGAARRGGLTAGLSAGSLADEVYRA